jgi:hypothetical protein
MDQSPTPVDSPHGRSDGLLVVSYRRGQWEAQESIEGLLVADPPPPAFVACVDPSKDEHGGRGRRNRRDYSRVNFLSDEPRLFDAY